MKRLFCIIGSLLICTSSVFAWNAESFLSDGSAEYQPYSLDPVEDSALDPAQIPMMLSLDDGIAVAVESGAIQSLSGYDLINSFRSSNQGVAIYVVYYVEGSELNTGSSSITLPGQVVPYLYPSTFSAITRGFSDNNQRVYFNYNNGIDIPAEIYTGGRKGYLEYFQGPVYGPLGTDDVSFLELSLDLSSFESFSTFGLSGSFDMSSFVYTGSNNILAYEFGGEVEVVVNGDVVRTFYSDSGTFNFNNFIFEATSDIQSVVLRLKPYLCSYYEGLSGVKMGLDLTHYDSFSFSVLADSVVLDGFNNQTQNDINEHQSIESQWTGSMTENFNALDLSGFTYPDGLVAAFALITGIFNDLWNGMGEYKILYVFPLTLGVVLLLIGRISKFSGRGSTSKSGKGDDSA